MTELSLKDVELVITLSRAYYSPEAITKALHVLNQDEKEKTHSLNKNLDNDIIDVSFQPRRFLGKYPSWVKMSNRKFVNYLENQIKPRHTTMLNPERKNHPLLCPACNPDLEKTKENYQRWLDNIHAYKHQRFDEVEENKLVFLKEKESTPRIYDIDHTISKEKIYVCEFCMYSSNSVIRLREHKQKEHLTQSQEPITIV